MATPHRTAAIVDGTVARESANANATGITAETRAETEIDPAIGIATVDDGTAAVVATGTPPAIMARTLPVAMPEVTRVGVEAGVVIPADTHVVTEVETEIIIAEATVLGALDLALLAGTIDPAERNEGIAMSAATAAVMMTETRAMAEDTAHPAIPLPRP